MKVAQRCIFHDNCLIGLLGDAPHHADHIGVSSCGNLCHYCYLIVKVVHFKAHPLSWVEGQEEVDK